MSAAPCMSGDACAAGSACAVDSCSHLPTQPADVWSAPVVHATDATTQYTAYSAAQLLAQLRHLQQDASYPHCDMLRQVDSTVEVCKQLLRKYGLIHTAFSFNGGKDCTVLLHLLRLAFETLAREDEAAAASIVSSSSLPASSTASSAVPAACSSEPPPPPWRLSDLTCIYFQEANEFAEIGSFMNDMAAAYSLQLAHMCGSFKDGLRELQRARPIRAIFMGQRTGDPGATAAAIAPSDPGWPVFDRVNPLLAWSYADVWLFLREFRLPYCTLYDRGYTSLGHKFNTVPNPALAIAPASTANGTSAEPVRYRPAWQLEDASREREGRFSANSTRGILLSPIPGVGALTPTPSPSPGLPESSAAGQRNAAATSASAASSLAPPAP